MEKELQEQLKKVLSDNVGNFWAGTDNIVSFIDQNFIGKKEVREIITNELTPHGYENDNPVIERNIQDSKIEHLTKLLELLK